MYLELLHVAALTHWARTVARSTYTRPCNQRPPRDCSSWSRTYIHVIDIPSPSAACSNSFAHNLLTRGRRQIRCSLGFPFSVHIQYYLYTHPARTRVLFAFSNPLCRCHLTIYRHTCILMYIQLLYAYLVL